MEERSRPKKHDGKLFKEGRCPNCGSEEHSDITGWCLYHYTPEIDGSLPYCPEDKRDRCFIQPIRFAFECLECYFVFDEKKVADNAHYNWVHCPIGVAYHPEFEEMKIEEYQSKLYEFTKYFEIEDIRKLVSKKYYLEALGKTHIQLARILKFVLSNKMEVIENEFVNNLFDTSSEKGVEIDEETLEKMKEENDKRKNAISGFLEWATDDTLHGLAFIFGIMDYQQRLEIKQFNKVRNDFVHTFDKAANHSDKYVTSRIEATLGIIEKLSEKVDSIIKDEIDNNFG